MCHPYKYRHFTQTSSVAKRVIIYVIPVISISFMLNLPKFFETKIVYTSQKTEVDFSPLRNGSFDQIELLMKLLNQDGGNTVTYEMTELRNNPDYIRYRAQG